MKIGFIERGSIVVVLVSLGGGVALVGCGGTPAEGDDPSVGTARQAMDKERGLDDDGCDPADGETCTTEGGGLDSSGGGDGSGGGGLPGGNSPGEPSSVACNWWNSRSACQNGCLNDYYACRASSSCSQNAGQCMIDCTNKYADCMAQRGCDNLTCP
jgi:hypothetical protein